MADLIDPSTLGQQYILFTGPLLIGLILDWMLQGTLIVQLYLYYTANRQDPIRFKLLVYGVFILDVIQTVFATCHTWNMVIVNWGNPGIIARPFWAGGVLPMLSGLISVLVQCFFAWRIYKLKPTLVVMGVAILIVAVALLQCISAIIESVQFVQDTSNIGRLFTKHYTWMSGTLIADLMVSISMVSILLTVRSSTSHFEPTHRMIMRLIIVTIEVGALTTVVAAAELAITNLYPQYYIYEVPAYILGKLSNNSLLVSLNARSYLSDGTKSMDGGTSGSFNQDVIRLRVSRHQGFPDTQADRDRAAIRITTETVTDHDTYLHPKGRDQTGV